MAISAIILCGFLFRLDGKGKDDPTFLPFPPFNNLYGWAINYARYAIPFVVFAVSHNPLHIVSYGIAVSIPYGEKHWWMKFGLASWLAYGVMYGLASLSWGMGLWLGVVVLIAKIVDLDQSWLEFGVFGMAATLWLAFK